LPKLGLFGVTKQKQRVRGTLTWRLRLGKFRLEIWEELHNQEHSAISVNTPSTVVSKPWLKLFHVGDSSAPSGVWTRDLQRSIPTNKMPIHNLNILVMVC